jgi:membrane protein implicated in regulation of membrane protease activity
MEHSKSGKFLYTDGHDVDVTSSTLRIKKTFYYLKGINDFGISIIKPNKLPALIVLVLGMTLLVDVFVSFIPDSFFISMGIPPNYVNSFAQLQLSIFLLLVGALVFLTLRRRYALRIATAEGEKKVLVSKNQEYIKQITEAIRRARLSLVPGPKFQHAR